MEDLGIMLVRIVVGLAFAAHGAQKLFGWFGGYGPKGTGGWFESIGVKPGVAAAVAVGIVEFFGGILVAVGLFTAVAAILLAATMVGAIVKVHAANGFWNTANGYEFNLVLIAILVAVALMGAGSYSIDHVLF